MGKRKISVWTEMFGPFLPEVQIEHLQNVANVKKSTEPVAIPVISKTILKVRSPRRDTSRRLMFVIGRRVKCGLQNATRHVATMKLLFLACQQSIVSSVSNLFTCPSLI